MKTNKELEEATELLGLDVRYVSGVTTPATGLPFILSKSKGDSMEKKMSWKACIAKQTEAGADDPEAVCMAMHAQTAKGKSKKLEDLEGEDIEADEDQDMDEVEKAAIAEYDAFYAEEAEKHLDHNQARHGWRYGNAQGGKATPPKGKRELKVFNERLKAKIKAERGNKGMDDKAELASDGAVANFFNQLSKMFETFTAKGKSGMVADDTGLATPKYPAQKYDAGDGIPDTTANPSVDEKSASTKTVATQNPEVIEGKAYAGSASESEVTEGKPVTKSYIDEFISRLESQAVNKEAMQVAREALEQAFIQPSEGEDNMREEDVRDLLLKALEPIIDAVEDLQAQDEVVAKSAAVEELTEKVGELSKQVGDLTDVVLMLKDRTGAGAALRPVQKSRVPANVTATPRKESGVWSNSPFDVAAGY